MIADLPAPLDYFDAGIGLFDFAWDAVASLVATLSNAEEFGIDAGDIKTVSEPYLKQPLGCP